MTHRNKLVDALSLIAGLGLTDEDGWLVMSPMFHAAGSFNVIPCLWVGATQVFLPPVRCHDRLPRAIEDQRATITFGVPTMLDVLGRRPAGTQRRRVVAAATRSRRGAHQRNARPPGRRHVPRRRALRHVRRDQMAPMATIHRHQERVLGTPRGRSAGQPALGVGVSIRDPHGRALRPHERGEIVVRGPNVTAGYWGQARVHRHRLCDGAYRSGDIGYLDEDGYLYVVDRSKDMIITGGENVYGTEVEDVLATHPAVAEAAVIGRAVDPRWGEIVIAVVVLRRDVSIEELETHCRGQLANYKVPPAASSLELSRSPDRLPESCSSANSVPRTTADPQDALGPRCRSSLRRGSPDTLSTPTSAWSVGSFIAALLGRYRFTISTCPAARVAASAPHTAGSTSTTRRSYASPPPAPGGCRSSVPRLDVTRHASALPKHTKSVTARAPPSPS